MVARVAKNWLRELLRTNMIKYRTLEEDVYKHIAVNFFNLILGWPNEHDPSIIFWGDAVKSRLRISFPRCLSDTELAPDYRLDDGIDMHALFERIQVLTGTRMSRFALRELQKNPKSFKVVISDVKRMDVVVKHMNVASLAEGNLLSMQAAQLLNQAASLDCSERLFVMAMTKFDRAIRATPDSVSVLSTYADVLEKRATTIAARTLVYPLFEKAIVMYKLSDNADALQRLGDKLATLRTTWSEQDKMTELSTKCYAAVAEKATSSEVRRQATIKFSRLLLR
jgi:hypothetical protein